MKNLFFVIATVAMILMVASCGGSGKSPKPVAEKYAKAMVADDYETMMECLYIASPDVDKQEYMDFLVGMSSEIDEDHRTLSMDYVSETVSEDGLQATVTFLVKLANGDESEMGIEMVKVEDKWLVDSGK